MWLFTTIAIAPASVVDRVVAVVGTDVVLASDIALDAGLSARDPSPLPFWRRGTAEQRQIDAAVLRAAAGDVALYDPPEEAARVRLEALRSTFPERSDWVTFLNGWGLDETSMLAVLERRLRVEAFLVRNLQTPPTNAKRWNAECTGLLTELKGRVRVRRVPANP